MQHPRQSFEDESGSEFVEWTVVLAILVGNGQPVEFGETLAIVE